MILSTLTTAERERLAYIEGYTEAAQLLAQLDDAQTAIDLAKRDNEILAHQYACACIELKYANDLLVEK